MAIIEALEVVKGFEVRGRLGKPNGVGEMWCGWSELGQDFPLAGLYRKIRHEGRQKFQRMKFYATPGPRTVEQQANRGKFASAISAWQALSPEEKKAWHSKKSPRFMSGYNRFIRDYMRDLI
jgi:hypothetical protein